MNKRTNEKILKRAIEQAKANGFVLRDNKHMVAIDHSGLRPMLGYESIIFSHDFAKAFWGEGEEYAPLPEWMYQLQQMVIQDDPIQYLAQFIDEKGGESA